MYAIVFTEDLPQHKILINIYPRRRKWLLRKHKLHRRLCLCFTECLYVGLNTLYDQTHTFPGYYQCIPGTTSSSTTTGAAVTTTSTTKAITTTLTTTTKTTAQTATATASSSGAATCTGTFSSISASNFISSLHPGWNLGNTLDAVPDEGSWNNAAVVASTFDTVKTAGFRSVRIPVTWAYHFTGSSPDWTVDPTWLQRVSNVVDMVVSRGLYAIVNVHHGMVL